MKTLKLGLYSTVAMVLLAASAVPAYASPALDLARQLNQAFIEVAEKVSPSVVVINVTQKAAVLPEWRDSEGNPWFMLPREFRRYFRQNFDDQPSEKPKGQGSGIILREDGYILTNRHVVEDAEKIEVRLKDGRVFKAVVRGMDPQSDVAVIKIDAQGLPAAKLGDSTQTRVGEFAIAIGAPFSLDYSVTFGHVSAKGRRAIFGDEGAAMDQDFIQTDANINPGNSGGPLVNIDGEVIGINTIIHGLRTGIGFAIPINLAREVADKLITEGKFTRAWLGVEIRSLHDDPDFSDLVKGVDDGVIVKAILPESPAAKSDLKATDVVTAVNGRPVSTAQQLRNEIRTKPIGQPVTLDVFRNGKKTKVKVILGEQKEEETAVVDLPVKQDVTEDASGLGLSVQTVTHQLADQFGVDLTPGVMVTSVDRSGLAARQGIKPGDVITEINQQPVRNPNEFRTALKGADLKQGVIVSLVSGKTSRFEILKEGDE